MNDLATPLAILAWAHVIAGALGLIAIPFVVVWWWRIHKRVRNRSIEFERQHERARNEINNGGRRGERPASPESCW